MREDLEAIERLLENKTITRLSQTVAGDTDDIISQLEAKFSVIQESFQRLESIMLKILQN